MNNSSLEQLLQLGILDEDFRKLLGNSNTVLRQNPSPSSSPSPSPSPSPGPGPSPNQEIVQYLSREKEAPPPERVPDDIEYYQNVTYHWLYSSPSYGWWHFSKDDNEFLETKYTSKVKQAIITVNCNSFTIDFERMLQYGSGKPRYVLRQQNLKDIVLKGVAGSRITKRDIFTEAVQDNNFGEYDI